MIQALLLAAILSVPTDTPLWRRDGAWVYPPKDVASAGRTAPATILVFRANGEFVEHHCWIIDGDGYRTISGGDPHVVVIGRWRAAGEELRVRRLRIARTVRAIGRDPLCDTPELLFEVRKDGVYGDAGEGRSGTYRPLKHLQSPDFEAYVNEAKSSEIVCPPR